MELMVVIIILSIVGLAAVICLVAGIACLLAASKEIQLPDIEDVEVLEDLV